MEIVRHEGVASDLKKLRRFAAPTESLEAWLKFFLFKGLSETPSVDQMTGFGELEIYKGRVVPLQENFGKSKGYRVIFQLINGDCCKILVFSRHGIYHDEQDLIDLVKLRLKS